MASKATKKGVKLAWKKKVNASMASIVGVRSDEELCGCMIEAYRPFSKVVNNCIKYRLKTRSTIVRRLLQKLLLLCYSIKKELPDTDHKQKHPLSYEKLSSIFLSQFVSVTMLSCDIDRQTKCSTISMHLCLILDSSVLHLVEAFLNVNIDLFEDVAANYFSVYEKIMDKCATAEMNVDLYLRCIVMSIHWFKVLPNNLKHNVSACLSKIGTESISPKEVKEMLRGDCPVITDKNRMSLKLLKKLSPQSRVALLESFNNDANVSLGSAIVKGAKPRVKSKESPSLPSSGLFFVDKKADENMIESLDLEGKETEKIQKETDALITDIDMTVSDGKNASQRKKGHYNGEVDEPDTFESDGVSSEEYQQDVANDGEETEEYDLNGNDTTASESSLESEEDLGKHQADEQVTKVPIFDKTKEEAEKIQRETDALIADIAMTIPDSKNVSQRKKGHYNDEVVEHDTVESDGVPREEHQQDLTIDGEETEEYDSNENDTIVSESSLESEEELGKHQADEGAIKVSIYDLIKAMTMRSEREQKGDNKAKEVALIAGNEKTTRSSKKKREQSLSNSEPEPEDSPKKKFGTVRSNETLNDDIQQDLTKEDSQDANESVSSEATVVYGSNSLASEQSFEKNRTAGRVTEASVVGKTNKSKKQRQPINCVHVKKDDVKTEKDTLIAVNDVTILGRKTISKRKTDHSNSKHQIDEKGKGKNDAIQPEENQQDLDSEVDQETEEPHSNESDVTSIAQSTLKSEEKLEKAQSGEQASKINALENMEEDDDKTDESSVGEGPLLSFKNVTPSSAHKLTLSRTNEKTPAPFSSADVADPPKKLQKLATSDGNEIDIVNVASSSEDSLDVQDVAQNKSMSDMQESPVTQHQLELGAVDNGQADSKAGSSMAVDEENTSDSDSDEEIICKRRVNSTSYHVTSSSEEDKNSDNEAVGKKSLPDNSDADSETGSDADAAVADFFVEEADEDKCEEDIVDSDETDINDFINDKTSESDDDEGSTEECGKEICMESPPKRKSEAYESPKRSVASEKPVEKAKLLFQSPVGSITPLPHSDKRIGPSSAKCDSAKASAASRSPSPNPYVPLTDVNSMFEAADGDLGGIPPAAKRTIQEETQIDSEEKNGEDETSNRKSSGKKRLKTPASMLRSQPRKTPETSAKNVTGSGSGDNTASSPSQVQPVVATPTLGFIRRPRRACNEAKSEQWKNGRTKENEVAETPVTKRRKMIQKRVAASAVAIRTVRKMTADSASCDKEGNTGSPPVRNAKPVVVSKTSPRVLRSGYKLRPRSPTKTFITSVK